VVGEWRHLFPVLHRAAKDKKADPNNCSLRGMILLHRSEQQVRRVRSSLLNSLGNQIKTVKFKPGRKKRKERRALVLKAIHNDHSLQSRSLLDYVVYSSSLSCEPRLHEINVDESTIKQIISSSTPSENAMPMIQYLDTQASRFTKYRAGIRQKALCSLSSQFRYRIQRNGRYISIQTI
jgi:hypothetical protein